MSFDSVSSSRCCAQLDRATGTEGLTVAGAAVGVRLEPRFAGTLVAAHIVDAELGAAGLSARALIQLCKEGAARPSLGHGPSCRHSFAR